MISTVDTTHIGARSPGPDTEVGICNEALQKHRNIINNIEMQNEPLQQHKNIIIKYKQNQQGE